MRSAPPSTPPESPFTALRRCGHVRCIRRANHRFVLGYPGAEPYFFCNKHADGIERMFKVVEHDHR